MEVWVVEWQVALKNFWMMTIYEANGTPACNSWLLYEAFNVIVTLTDFSFLPSLLHAPDIQLSDNITWKTPESTVLGYCGGIVLHRRSIVPCLVRYLLLRCFLAPALSFVENWWKLVKLTWTRFLKRSRMTNILANGGIACSKQPPFLRLLMS